LYDAADGRRRAIPEHIGIVLGRQLRHVVKGSPEATWPQHVASAVEMILSVANPKT
jgi:acyl carrier protein phosphodiesterase